MKLCENKDNLDLININIMISFDDFKKIELKIGKIISAERVEGSDKLIKLMVDFGTTPETPTEENPAPTPTKITRQIVAGIATAYEPESLINKEFVFVFNLEPRMLKGIESQGMILAATNDGLPVLISPDRPVDPGSSLH